MVDLVFKCLRKKAFCSKTEDLRFTIHSFDLHPHRAIKNAIQVGEAKTTLVYLSSTLPVDNLWVDINSWFRVLRDLDGNDPSKYTDLVRREAHTSRGDQSVTEVVGKSLDRPVDPIYLLGLSPEN